MKSHCVRGIQILLLEILWLGALSLQEQLTLNKSLFLTSFWRHKQFLCPTLRHAGMCFVTWGGVLIFHYALAFFCCSVSVI